LYEASFLLSAVFALLVLPSSLALCAQESSPDFSFIDSNLEKGGGLRVKR
jgi:hypothetical protein